MNRTALKRNVERREKLFIGGTNPSEEYEETDKIFAKFLSGEDYEPDNINTEVNEIFKKNSSYGYSYHQNFRLLENMTSDEIDRKFTGVKLQENKPFYSIAAKKKNQWVLVCLLKVPDQEEILLLYQDPCQVEIPNVLRTHLETRFGKTRPCQNQNTELSSACVETSLHGPLVLRNLVRMIKIIEKNKNRGKDQIATVFFVQQFATRKELMTVRLKQVSSMVEELKKKSDFKDALKKFIEDLPLQMCENMESYQKALESELTKNEAKIDHENIDATEAIDAARKKFLPSEDDLNEMMNKYKIKNDRNIEGKKSDIEEKWGEEMQKLRAIFIILDQVNNVDGTLDKALNLIAKALGIRFEILRRFYNSKPQKDMSVDEEILKLVIGDVTPAPVLNKPCPQCTSLEGILRGIVLRGEETTRTLDDQINDLKRKFLRINEIYKKHEQTTPQAIMSWAKEKKGKLGTTDEDICEALARMDRAFVILNGYNFRIPQLLSALIFLHSNNNRGRMCQIQTGEGKTTIVAMVATVKCLQGEQVDVITSNPVLAHEGCAESKKFLGFFGLTTATNNPDAPKIGYTADVLYGCISSFQFDYLREQSEGLNVRKKRRFDVVVLDEVDSMLIDNGGQIAKLASPFPGMECLRYIYIKIWAELEKAEKQIGINVKKRLNEIDEQYKYKDQQDKRDEMMQQYLDEFTTEERNKIKDSIREAEPHNLSFMAPHLKEYSALQLDGWIRNAIYAKYTCHENHHYTILNNERIAPVDYLNTGITLNNTIWSDGLHQFLQLKHQLALSFETMTSCFLSNIGYIRKYQHKNIFGMTGTLGSTAEQNLLKGIYKIDFATMPTYVTKDFREVPGCVFEDDAWETEVVVKIMDEMDKNRSVLAIFETMADVNAIHDKLNKIQEAAPFQVKRYANEDDAAKGAGKLDIRTIVLATNIAGRGTNFKTQPALEANGGLHVFVCFLPCNLRVQGQAFGRTSRQGKKGTAQLLVRVSELEKLALYKTDTDFVKIKRVRDKVESHRLDKVEQVLVKELDFMDALYEKFAVIYREKAKESKSPKITFVLNDLKESWAFWLRKKNFKIDSIEKTSVDAEFQSFKSTVKDTLEKNRISYNPLNAVGLANMYMESGELNDAIQALDDVKGGVALPGVQLKLFEANVKNGHQLMERFIKAMAETFFIPYTKDETYKEKATKNLAQAQHMVKQEIEFIREYIQGKDTGVSNVIYAKDNPITKSINSRLTCLETINDSIKHLAVQIDKMENGFDLNGKQPLTKKDMLASMKTENANDKLTKKTLETNLNEDTFRELPLVGLDVLYAIREIPDVDKWTIRKSQRQILIGITCFSFGIAFPPSFPQMLTIASSLIPEGILDIVIALISTNPVSENHRANVMKMELISYGKSLLGFGISAIKQSVTILKKGISICHKLSSWLRQCSFLPGLCNKLADYVDKFAKILETQLKLVEFSKLATSGQITKLAELQKTDPTLFEKLGGANRLAYLQKYGELHQRGAMFVVALKEIGKATLKLGTQVIFQQVVIPAVTEFVKDKIKRIIAMVVKEELSKNDQLMKQLRRAADSQITASVDAFVAREKFSEKLTKLCSMMSKCVSMNNQLLDFANAAITFMTTSTELISICDMLQNHLCQELKDQKCDNDVGEICERISGKLAERIFSLFCDLYQSGKKLHKYAVEMRNWKKGDPPLFTIDKKKTIDNLAKLAEEEVAGFCRKKMMMINEDESLSDLERVTQMTLVKEACAGAKRLKIEYDKEKKEREKKENLKKEKEPKEEKKQKDTKIFEIK